MNHAYTLDTFKEKILGKQPGLKGKLEVLETRLHVQSQPAARQSALAEFLKREVSLKQASDRTVFAWRRPDGVECTLELGQDDDFGFFGPDEPDSPAVPAAAPSPRAAAPTTVSTSDEEAAKDHVNAEKESAEADERGETVDAESEEGEFPETDSDDEAAEEQGEAQPEDTAEADPDEASFTPGALFATLAANLGKGATAVLTVAKDGDNLTVTYTPRSAGDTAEHDRPFAVTAAAAELDHPSEGFVTLIGATTQARKTLTEAKKEYEAAVKAEADAKKAATKKTSAAKAKTESTAAKTTTEVKPKTELKDEPKSQEAPLFG